VILATQNGAGVHYAGVERALAIPETEVLLFGKPEARPYRRMGVALARGATTAEAQRRADAAAACIEVGTGPETGDTPGSAAA
jgi:phosphoribosylglycinamide formyltransferase 2